MSNDEFIEELAKIAAIDEEIRESCEDLQDQIDELQPQFQTLATGIERMQRIQKAAAVTEGRLQ